MVCFSFTTNYIKTWYHLIPFGTANISTVGSGTMPVLSWYQQCDTGDLEQNFNALVITMIK
jgi:hypothetical protein